MTATATILRTEISGQEPKRGKVRDIYDLGERLLIVTTDRISAFDVVMVNGIPDKGKLLTQISFFWLDWLGEKVKNHLISTEVDDFGEPFCQYGAQLAQRSMLVKKTKVLPVECVVRGYLAGSGWQEYQQEGSVCGQRLEAGLKQCSQLSEPIFTPATKAEQGEHDENISYARMVDIIGSEAAAYVQDASMEIYIQAAEYARERGIILADTKFEWGYENDEIILIDEVLTPDSSRFWPADKYEEGRDQESFDKQFVRNYLERIHFNKQAPGVELSDEVVMGTQKRYIEAYERLSGKPWETD